MISAFSILRHGVVPALRPGVTTADTLRSKPAAFEETILADRLIAVVRAGWAVDAARRHPRRDCRLVEADELESKPAHHEIENEKLRIEKAELLGFLNSQFSILRYSRGSLPTVNEQEGEPWPMHVHCSTAKRRPPETQAVASSIIPRAT